MPYAAAQSRALGRGRTRVSVGRAIPFYLVLTQSGLPFSQRSGTFGRSASSLPGLFWCLPTCTAGIKTQEKRSWLHSAARPASGFPSIAPIQTTPAPPPPTTLAPPPDPPAPRPPGPPAAAPGPPGPPAAARSPRPAVRSRMRGRRDDEEAPL